MDWHRKPMSSFLHGKYAICLIDNNTLQMTGLSEVMRQISMSPQEVCVIILLEESKIAMRTPDRPGVPNPAPGDRLSCTVHLKP